MFKGKILLSSALFLISGYLSKAQTDSTIKARETTAPVVISLGYRMPVNNHILINSGHGLAMELGINPLYFFSKKHLLGAYVGSAFSDRLWSTSFNGDFTEDYNASIKDQSYSTMDSAIINASKRLFSEMKGRELQLPGCKMSSFHSSSYYCGIIAKIPIEKYPLLLKLYGGSTKTSYLGDEEVTQNTDYNYFAIKRRMYGCELSLFPGKKITDCSGKHKPFTKMYLGTLSFYYEYCDLANASLYFTDGDKDISLPFKSYLSETFTSKYKNEVSCGFKLSLNIY